MSDFPRTLASVIGTSNQITVSNDGVGNFTLSIPSVLDITTGFRIGGAATSGNVLRGNGTNFISATLAAADLSNGTTGSGGGVVLATSPTITTPTIASFTNATHNHQNAAGGGTVAEAALALTDITTANVSTSAHGFVPKAPNSTAQFLRGDATWATLTASPFPTFTAQSANFTATSNTSYMITASSKTGNLPASPADGDYVCFVDGASITGFVIGRNGKTIMGLSSDMTVDAASFQIVLVYLSSTGDWRLAI